MSSRLFSKTTSSKHTSESPYTSRQTARRSNRLSTQSLVIDSDSEDNGPTVFPMDVMEANACDSLAFKKAHLKKMEADKTLAEREQDAITMAIHAQIYDPVIKKEWDDKQRVAAKRASKGKGKEVVGGGRMLDGAGGDGDAEISEILGSAQKRRRLIKREETLEILN